MAEWFKAAVLKTADRKVRGFESYSLRQLTVVSYWHLKYNNGKIWGPGQARESQPISEAAEGS